MTLEGLLIGVIAGLLLMNWPVAVILLKAALERPRITALNVMAVASLLIATGITIYVFAVIDSGVGYIINRQPAQTLFRLILICLAAFPLWFLWLYKTDRFDDGGG